LEACYVNMDDGYVEAICRSLRKGFLTEYLYEQLKQTGNITDFKLVLEDTDYGANLFKNQTGDQFEVALMRRAMKEKLAQDLNFMKASAVEPLRSFIDMIQHAYQLENVIFVIEGLKGGRTIEQMMKTVDPIGYFRELEQMTPIDSDDYASMYQNVLVDLPIGVYFKKFLDEMVDQTVVPADSGNEVDAKFI